MNILKNRKFKYGGLSILFTVIFITAIILVNVIFNLVLDRFDFTADLSYDGLYSIDHTTEEYLKTINQDVDIIVAAEESDFVNAGTYYKQTSEIIRLFTGANGRFHASYYDLNSNPDKFAKYGTSVSSGCIIVESRQTGMYRVISSNEYLDPKYSMNGQEISEEEATAYNYLGYGAYINVEPNAAAELCLLSAVMIVTDDNPTKVAMATGFGEGNSTVINELLEKNVYISETVDMSLAAEISTDIDILFIFNPEYDYSAEALDQIDRWLDNGGKYGKTLLYIPSVRNFDTPNLDEFLADWGIQVEKGFLCQTDANYAYQAGSTYQLLELQETEYSAAVDNVSMRTIGDQLRPVTRLFDENSNYSTEAIVKTYDGAVIKPYNAGDAWQTSDAKESGAYDVLAESRKTVYDGTIPSHSRVIVFGGPVFLNDMLLQAEQYNNAEIFVSLLNTASGKEETEIPITSKPFALQTFEITGAQANGIAIVFCIVIPILVIAAGAVVVVRRKRR